MGESETSGAKGKPTLTLGSSDLSSITPTSISVRGDTGSTSRFGGSVTFADVNGDGYDDAIIGDSFGRLNQGRVTVIYGSESAGADGFIKD